MKYTVFLTVTRGDDRENWVSFQKTFRSMVVLARRNGFRYREMNGLAIVTDVTYDHVDDTMDVEIQDRKFLAKDNEFIELRQDLERDGWEFVEGRWDGGFIC
jgi:hypothetical protein